MVKYFFIPFKNIPDNPEYTVWYAAWSNQRPVIEPGMNQPVVIGVTNDDNLPPSATLIAQANSTKDPNKPPPPPTSGGTDEYQAALKKWLESVMGD